MASALEAAAMTNSGSRTSLYIAVISVTVQMPNQLSFTSVFGTEVGEYR